MKIQSSKVCITCKSKKKIIIIIIRISINKITRPSSEVTILIHMSYSLLAIPSLSQHVISTTCLCEKEKVLEENPAKPFHHLHQHPIK